MAFFCSSPSWGGLEINVIRLAGWLKALDLPLVMMVARDTPLHHEAIKHGFETIIIPHHRKYLDFGAAGTNATLLRRFGITFLFVFHRNDTDVAAWMRFFGGRRLKVIYQQQMRLGVSRKDPVHAMRYRAYNAWITPLEYLREEVLALTTVQPEKIHVIPLGIEVGHYRESPSSPAEARNFFGLGEGTKVFGIMGRIEPGKGQAFLVKALKNIRENTGRGPATELLIVGDTTIEPGSTDSGQTHRDELRKLVASLGLEKAVHFHPFISDNRMFYRAVDACVMATSQETYGMVTLEAMASGVPVIGTDATGTREILDGGRLGLLFTPGDEEAFVRHAGTVINGKYPDRMLDEANDTVREKYSHTRECEMIIDLLDRLATGA